MDDISILIKEVQKELSEVLEIELSEYENNIIEKSIRYPFVKSFNSIFAMTEMIQSILSNISELSYIRQKIYQKKYELSLKHDVVYNQEFTRLTRIGRPSKQAIESEIYSTKEDISNINNKIKRINNFLDYMDNLIEILKATYHNYEAQRYKQ